MKRVHLYLPLAALILATLAFPARAQQQIPFKGTFQGQDTHIGTALDTNATGTGTLLGQFSFTQDLTISLVNGTLTDAGSGHWVAANGDIIETTVVGWAEPASIPGYLKVTEVDTITGGTGRFNGAQGSFIVTRLHKIALVPGTTDEHVTFGSFSGIITSPSAAQ